MAGAFISGFTCEYAVATALMISRGNLIWKRLEQMYFVGSNGLNIYAYFSDGPVHYFFLGVEDVFTWPFQHTDPDAEWYEFGTLDPPERNSGNMNMFVST